MAEDAAAGRYRGRRRAEEPVGGVELVTRQLREQPPRVLAVETPVPQVVPGRISPPGCVEVRHRRLSRPAPVAVAVPHHADVVHVPKKPLLDDAVVGGLIDAVISALITDLENAVVLLGRRYHALAA